MLPPKSLEEFADSLLPNIPRHTLLDPGEEITKEIINSGENFMLEVVREGVSKND